MTGQQFIAEENTIKQSVISDLLSVRN